MRVAAGSLLLFLLVLWSSCRSDFEADEFMGQLEFSKDTVFLDTVFSNLSTSTYSLKVYNTGREDIFIPEITLENGENSHYRLNVDGIPGKSFENIEVLARDSIYIFIETTVGSNNSEEQEFLYIDKLQFKSATHLQEIPLVTLVKDAVFMFPSKNAEGLPEQVPVGEDENGNLQLVPGFYLQEGQLNFTAGKPYVIYGYAAVPENMTLKVEAGARIYFHKNSGIIVSNNASLQVQGKLSEDPQKMENEVIFRGDRLENIYKNLPGQWGSIWLRKGSKNHIFEYATIKNATVGILVEGTAASPTPLTLKNVQIYNSAISGIRAENAEIWAENLVINRSGQASLHLTGGKHSFIHSTIVNYWQQGFREYPALFLQNFSDEGPAPLEASFYNSIIFGNESRELGFNHDENVSLDIFFSHGLLKFTGSNEPEPFYDFGNNMIYDNIRLNQEPMFLDPKENDLRLQENSAAIDFGDSEVAKQVPTDLFGHNRTISPDLGAHEFVKIKE
ncbi:hypothetical protein [Salinimicrobium xinjiangense]|uniref:hypothetical protein n=1 Tax=Salinimicrobium xinjiangense TaxID=438596 RepID=UPI00040BECC0|nr:hypothetical protein [Salinimicrobium xinjiangense]